MVWWLGSLMLMFPILPFKQNWNISHTVHTLISPHLCPEVCLIQCLDRQELIFILDLDGRIQLTPNDDVDLLILIQLPLAVPVGKKVIPFGVGSCWTYSALVSPTRRGTSQLPEVPRTKSHLTGMRSSPALPLLKQTGWESRT